MDRNTTALEAERLSRELLAFYRLARAFAAGPYDVQELLERVTSEIRDAFALERALLARYNPDEDGVQAVVQQNVVWPGDDWLPLAAFPILQEALATRAAVFHSDPRDDGAIPVELIERFGVSSLVVLPLVTEGRIVGFFIGDRDGREFELGEQDLQLLTAIGSVAAVFLEAADLYAELRETLEELRHLDAVKSDFISIASHELRTPIAVVHGVAATLFSRGDDLDRSQHEDLRRLMFEQTTRLSEMTDQLLDLSRFDAGAVRVQKEWISPRERCEEVVRRSVPDRVAEIDIAVDAELRIETDAHAFDRVVTNLVVNATRYGRPPVTVDARVDDGRFLLAVEDRGDGVPAAFEPMLFDRFTRGDSNAGPRGTGLGLAIAQSFARATGGEIRYERAVPHGARFVLDLPT